MTTLRRLPLSSDGFVLVELLVSLAILVLLSVMLVQALGGQQRAWRRIDGLSEDSEIIEAAQAVLRDRVQHVWPETNYQFAPAGPNFIGHSTSMLFLAPPGGATGHGPVRLYQLSLDTNGDLILNWRSQLALDWRNWAGREVLVRGVQSLELSYYGAPARTPAWRTDWDKQPFMPALVRIDLSFGQGDRRLWPSLVIHPMADIDTICSLDVATGGCRGR